MNFLVKKTFINKNIIKVPIPKIKLIPKNLNSTIQWFAPVATSVVSIGAYQYFHDTLKIEDIMTSLRIFNSIQGPIRMIPGLINNFNEVAISMKRIQKYLFQDEIKLVGIIFPFHCLP